MAPGAGTAGQAGRGGLRGEARAWRGPRQGRVGARATPDCQRTAVARGGSRRTQPVAATSRLPRNLEQDAHRGPVTGESSRRSRWAAGRQGLGAVATSRVTVSVVRRGHGAHALRRGTRGGARGLPPPSRSGRWRRSEVRSRVERPHTCHSNRRLCSISPTKPHRGQAPAVPGAPLGPAARSLSTAAPAALRPPAPPPLLCRPGRPGCLKRSDSRGGFEEKNMVLKTQNTQRVSARGKYRNRGAWRGGHRALLAWAVPTGKRGLVTKLQALRGPRARDPIGCHGAEGKLRPGESGPRGQSAPRDRPPRLRRLRAGFPGCHPCFRAAGLP